MFIKTFSSRPFAATITALALFVAPSVASAEVRCASPFTDHMVLQRQMKVPVWGWADPGEKVTVNLGSQSKSAVTDTKGNWFVHLDPLKAGGPLEMSVSGTNTIKFTDVLIGEVWLCSGQSNMELILNRVMNAQKEIAAANYPDIRLLLIKKAPAFSPQTTCSTIWKLCTSENATSFSATALFLGRHLREKLGVPIGLIDSSYGGTPAESWTPKETLSSDPDLSTTLKALADYTTTYPLLLAKYEAELKAFKSAKGNLKTSDSKTTATAPRKPPSPNANPRLATVLYNAMIAPVAPYAIRGAAWYQGENNAPRAWQYRKLLPAMISSWRKKWGEGNFPFLIVQLANYVTPTDLTNENWAELREAQSLTARNVPNCAQAVIIDIGEAGDIHPKNKQEVGRRLGLLAEKLAYGHKVECFGPTYESVKFTSGKAVIKFNNTGKGLEARGGATLTGFTIAGDDHKFQPADAKIAGGEIIVSSATVPKPVAVRYAWNNNPTCNLINKDGLSASPFRTDDWPLHTLKER